MRSALANFQTLSLKDAAVNTSTATTNRRRFLPTATNSTCLRRLN